MYFCILKIRNTMKKMYFIFSLLLGITLTSCNSKEDAKSKLKSTIDLSEEEKALEEEMEKLDQDVEELDTLVEILKH